MRRLLVVVLATRCLAREHGPPLGTPATAHIDSVAGLVHSGPIQSGRALQDSSSFGGDAFRCVSITRTSTDWQFDGATTADNGLVILTPSWGDCVGVFNLTDNAYDCIDISAHKRSHPTGDKNEGHYNIQFSGGALAGNGNVILPPFSTYCLGVFNPADNTFSCVDTSLLVSRTNRQWQGAATANGHVILAPFWADCIGVYSPATNSFSIVNISVSCSLAGDAECGKFRGAVTAGNGLVILVPSDADCVGVFNPANSAFSCVDISSHVTVKNKFTGATMAANGQVIFAPRNADCVAAG